MRKKRRRRKIIKKKEMDFIFFKYWKKIDLIDYFLKKFFSFFLLCFKFKEKFIFFSFFMVCKIQEENFYFFLLLCFSFCVCLLNLRRRILIFSFFYFLKNTRRVLGVSSHVFSIFSIFEC
jgi:hypothetical protein